MVRRIALPVFGLACFASLLLACFRTVLFEDGQFAHFDAAFFYYPLYERVQQEWAAGRWPLWDPGQNGGTPLLAIPMAAVLYPGKVVYAVLPYAWAARLYVIVHACIAFLGVLALARSFGVSGVGSILSGLSYAFGAPVLLLHGNVILLVGAAWLPWGLRAIDQLLRRHRRRGMAELAAVLALQVLGGDPEAAYLTVVAGAGYAVALGLGGRKGPSRLPFRLLAVAATGVWVLGTLVLAYARPALPAAWQPGSWVPAFGVWTVLGLGLLARWLLRHDRAPLAPLLVRLGCASVLALALTAVQLLPVLEYAGRSVRVAEGTTMNVFRFSIEPHRFLELLWPNLFGTRCPENRSWLSGILPANDREPWLVSLYMGGLGLLLAGAAWGTRGGPPWRAWLSVVAIVGLALSLGRFASPLWWARWGPFGSVLGPHDALPTVQRDDGFLDDGFGSPFAILGLILPGFGVFRFPMKLMTLTAAALAVLAGAGWDRLAAGETTRVRCLGWAGLGASLLVLVLVLAGRGPIVAALTSRVPADPIFGPADIPGAWAGAQRALVHGAIIFAAGLALAHQGQRRPRFAGVLALLLVTSDLAAANAALVWTVPQVEFEAAPEAARRIAAAEPDAASSGPFRIHRIPGWLPPRFLLSRSPRRLSEAVAWRRATLDPLYGVPLGLEYCATLGILELDDQALFFQSRTLPVPAPMAEVLGISPGQPVRYHTRRGFDLWGARYFLLPTLAEWEGEVRGFASFLDETDLIYPEAAVLKGQPGRAADDPWSVRNDWQLRRNRTAYPRAWLVHYARVRPPATSLEDRQKLMGQLLYMNDPIWSIPGRDVLDLRAMTWIETDDPAGLRGIIARRPVEPSESVTVTRHEPQQVELDVVLNRPGLVILADTYYPGWHLTIDGHPAPIYRANRTMRGAAVPAGKHTLVYTFKPQSFFVGAIISGAGALAVVALLVRRGPGKETL